eukprot:3234182-Amphidinium_carterae.1
MFVSGSGSGTPPARPQSASAQQWKLVGRRSGRGLHRPVCANRCRSCRTSMLDRSMRRVCIGKALHSASEQKCLLITITDRVAVSPRSNRLKQSCFRPGSARGSASSVGTGLRSHLS